jgi:hypothetical protein
MIVFIRAFLGSEGFQKASLEKRVAWIYTRRARRVGLWGSRDGAQFACRSSTPNPMSPSRGSPDASRPVLPMRAVCSQGTLRSLLAVASARLPLRSLSRCHLRGGITHFQVIADSLNFRILLFGVRKQSADLSLLLNDGRFQFLHSLVLF